MSDYYILRGRDTYRVDRREWAEWFEKADRLIKVSDGGISKVSTVFLGIDHSFVGGGRPILFETMVFGGPLDEEMDRYCTMDQAEDGHDRMVQRCKDASWG